MKKKQKNPMMKRKLMTKKWQTSKTFLVKIYSYLKLTLALNQIEMLAWRE
jgi:hypothetical protein